MNHSRLKRNGFLYPILLFQIFLLSFNVSFSQLGFEFNDSIVVKNGTQTLINPWAGGLNYTQISDFDFDLDGDRDLFVFDRSSNNIRVFIQELESGSPYYKYVHNAWEYFPQGLKYRVQLVDYDQDGRKDLFTWGIGGLKVYRNESDIINGLQWNLFQEIVYSEYAVGGNSNLSISLDDIPAIVDVDFDGDIDVLTTDIGGAHIEYHQNQSMELYGIPDSLIYIQKNQCWGKFSESPTSSVLILNDQSPPCVGGDIPFPERSSDPLSNNRSGGHSGATILAIDIDSSGVMDLILGDDSYNNLTLTINGGTSVNSDSPMVSFDDAFPSYTTPVKCYIFPAAFYVDVDFDGKKDLLTSPNSKNGSLNKKSIFFYKNIGSNGVPVFTPITDQFLQSEMIENGTGSIPTLFDYDDDGLKDLMVANFFRYKPIQEQESTICFYKNTGSANAPEYSLVDEDVFNLSLESYGLRTVPAFGDIDGDGDDDIFLGLEDGSLIFMENMSTGTGAIWGQPILNYADNLSIPINVGTFAHPQLFDINDDGLLDLLIGCGAGKIIYYKNIGSPGAPSFNLENNFLGNIDLVPSSSSERCAPHFFKNNGETILFCGSSLGTLIYYDSIVSNLGQGMAFNEVSTNFLEINVGSNSAFWVEDIDEDGQLNMFVGQDLGGLWHFEVNPQSSAHVKNLTNNSNVSVYPNPTADEFSLSSEEVIEKLIITNLKGEIVYDTELWSRKSKCTISMLASGVYILNIRLVNGQVVKKKIVVLED